MVLLLFIFVAFYIVKYYLSLNSLQLFQDKIVDIYIVQILFIFSVIKFFSNFYFNSHYKLK